MKSRIAQHNNLMDRNIASWQVNQALVVHVQKGIKSRRRTDIERKPASAWKAFARAGAMLQRAQQAIAHPLWVRMTYRLNCEGGLILPDMVGLYVYIADRHILWIAVYENSLS